jgi:adenylate cyclase
MADQARSGRYSLRFTISTLLVSLLILAVGGALGIALLVRNRSVEATSAALLEQVGSGLEQMFTNRFRPAESMLRSAVDDAADGRLLHGLPEAWGPRIAARIRYNPTVEWMGFIAPNRRGAGAFRTPEGQILILYSTGGDDGEDQETVIAQPNDDGGFEVLSREAVDFGRYQEVSWYALGAEADRPIWSPRYVRRDGELGRACALGYRKDGALQGVFAVGFGLAFVEQYVRDVRPGGTGSLFVLRAESGEVGLGPEPEIRSRLQPVVEAAIGRLPDGVRGLEAAEQVVERVQHDGEDFVVGLTLQDFSESMRWVNAIVISEAELVGYLGTYLRWGLLGVLGLLGVAALLALILSHRISSPLRGVASDLRRVGTFDLDAPPIPASRIREVATVGQEVERMKTSLRSFGHYVPTDLVRQLVKEGEEASLGGEMRELTLFFSDVRGFTSVSEGMAVQTLVDALGEYLDVVVKALADHGGTVDKFMGDGVLAFFNAPIAAPSHVADACHAALAVQAALAAHRDDWTRRGLPDFATRIGLHAGKVLVGNIGTPDRFGYTVLGDGVNLAARLESLNKAYGTWILASEETRRLAGDGFVWRRIDRTAVAGRKEGGDVYELVGVEGEVQEEVLRAHDLYEAAFQAYLDRRFESAADAFDDVLRRMPADGAAKALAQRARQYVASPPPEDWSGVYVQTKK